MDIEKKMADRWVNAVIEIRVPMNIDPSALIEQKMKAAEEIQDEIMARLEPVYSEHVDTVTVEDMLPENDYMPTTPTP